MAQRTFKEKDLQQLVGNILRGGVIIAMAIVVIGIALFIIHNGSHSIDYTYFSPIKFQGIAEVFRNVFRGDAESIIQLGVLLLIATPIARIVFAMIGYWLEGDKLYVMVSLIILAVIISSIIYGAVE